MTAATVQPSVPETLIPADIVGGEKVTVTKRVTHIKVDKNIPVPSNLVRKGREGIYPYTTMKVGESFLIPKGKELSAKSCAVHQIKNHNLTAQFAFYPTSEGLRCWRIK